MTNAFTIPKTSTFTKDELLRMAKARAGSKGGTVKNERNDAKSAMYINTRTK
jgi:hypothetical protein